MIALSITIADMSPNDTTYTVQYGKIMEEFTVPLDLINLSVIERQKAIASMISVMFEAERQAKLEERPGETPEAQMLDDLLDDLAEDEDDDE